MILGEKILQLRKQNNWSQEELAEKCGVSRQSISKWEIGGSIPDINNIMLMSQLFGVSTDYLLKDDMEAEEYNQGDEAVPPKKMVSLTEANQFMELKERYAPRVALGVSLCILSPVMLMIMMCMAELKRMSEEACTGIGIIVLLCFVAIAVTMFITTDHQLKEYEYLQKEVIGLEYGVEGIVAKKNEEYSATYGKYTAIGVAFCILSAVPIFVAVMLNVPDAYFLISVGVLLVLVSIGVSFLIRVGEIKGCYDQLLQKGDYSAENKKAEKVVGKIGAVYWPLVVAIYLGYSFVTNNWGDSWIIWPVAGVAFGAVAAICKIVKGNAGA